MTQKIERVIPLDLLENNGGSKSPGPGSSSSGCSSRGKNSDGHRNDAEGQENFGLEIEAESKSFQKTEI